MHLIPKDALIAITTTLGEKSHLCGFAFAQDGGRSKHGVIQSQWWYLLKELRLPPCNDFHVRPLGPGSLETALSAATLLAELRGEELSGHHALATAYASRDSVPEGLRGKFFLKDPIENQCDAAPALEVDVGTVGVGGYRMPLEPSATIDEVHGLVHRHPLKEGEAPQSDWEEFWLLDEAMAKQGDVYHRHMRSKPIEKIPHRFNATGKPGVDIICIHAKISRLDPPTR